jgi:hypothetical protein
MKLDMMTEQDLRKLVLTRFQTQGLGDVISLTKSQFLEMSLSHDSFFVEVALTQANRLADAERVLRVIKDEFSAQAVALEYIVRAMWEVVPEKIKRNTRPFTTGMPIKLATGILFHASLRSGEELTDVEVLVTSDALDIVAARFGYPVSEPFQWSADKEVNEQTLKDLIVRFLEEELSHGGQSYWDPVKYPELELNAPAVSYLLGHSAALMELVEALNGAFHPMALAAFLHSLELSSVRVSEFDRALPQLSNFLGGAYTRGQAFSVSAPALYSGLKPSEQELLRHHYQIKVDRLLAEHPELRQQFPKTLK